MKRVVPTMCVITLLAACTSDEQRTTDRELVLDSVAQFGSLDGALALRHVGSLTLTQGRGDTILVTQLQVPAILVLSADGDSLGMIGRAGSGPGEFRAPFQPFILRDTIWAPNLGGSVLRFDGGLDFVDQLRIAVPPLGPYQHPPTFVAALPDGSLLLRGSANPVGREAREAVRALAYVRSDRNGTVLDTLALVAVRESSYVLRFSDGRGIVGSHPAANPDLGSADPAGRWIVAAAQVITESDRFGFRLSWINTQGDTVATHFVETAQISSARLKSQWIEELIATEGRGRGDVEQAAAEVPFPEYQAPALALFVDANGRAWIRSPHESADSSLWFVVEQGRGQIGQVASDGRLRLMAAHEPYVWGWTQGQYDEAIIVKFRATW